MVKLLLLAANLLVAQGALIQVHETLDASEVQESSLLPRVQGFQVQPATVRATPASASADPVMKARIKVNDMVKVISGDSKGTVAKVLEVMDKKDMAVVEGVNVKTKHQKPVKEGESGSIQKKEAPIHRSNIVLADVEEPARTGEPQMRVRSVVMSAEGAEDVDEGSEEAVAAEEPVAEEAVAEEAAAEEAPKKKKGGRKFEKDVSGFVDFDPKEFITGKVSSVQPFGAFVRLEGGVDGLVHVSQISDDFVEDVAETGIKVGDEVKVRVIKVDADKAQIALSMKEWQEPRQRKPRVDRNAQFNAFAEKQPDEKAFITGTVNQIMPFGAFVTIAEGVDGLLHISQIRDGYLGDVEDALSTGQEVQVRVTELDKQKKRVGLSMKEWKEPGTEDEEEKKGKRRGGGGRGGGGFGEDDAPFRMNDAELEELNAGFNDEPEDTVFGAAFARMDAKQKA
jgi:ribosomal protein L24